MTLKAITPANDQLTADRFYLPTFIMARTGGGISREHKAVFQSWIWAGLPSMMPCLPSIPPFLCGRKARAIVQSFSRRCSLFHPPPVRASPITLNLCISLEF